MSGTFTWTRSFALAATAVVLGGCVGSIAPPIPGADVPPPGASSLTHVLHLGQPRAVHRAITLDDGRVLITGGCTRPGCGGFEGARRSELFDPERAIFTPGPQMRSARASGSATLLGDGRVLLVGGYPAEGKPPTSAAEVFDPVSSTFRAVGSLAQARADQSATLLTDGRVLVAGGFGHDGHALSSTELFDPTSNTFAAAASLSEPRAAQVAVSVGSAVVLIGGTRSGPALASTDVMRQGAWAPGPTLRQARVKLGAVTLADRRVLVIGGAQDTEGHRKLATTELLDIADFTSEPGPPLGEGEYKLDGAVTVLPDARVVIAGGSRLEVFDPRDDTLTRLSRPLLVTRSFLTATTIGRARVLVAGGYDDQIVPTDLARLITIP